MNKIISGTLTFLFITSILTPSAHANPSFNQAESGAIQIDEAGSVYNITSSNGAIGNFNSFSNTAGETINSFQASSDHTALFRVTGGDPSTIFGALNANSRIFLVNPNGILFGPGSSVNAPGLVASALNISNSDFMSGTYAFNATSSTGGLVTNQGVLSGDYYIVLLGKAVRNEGTITSPGTAALAAGDSARLLLDPDGLVSIDVTAASSSAVYNADGSRVNDAIANTGTLSADGGAVLMTARAAEGIFDNVINHSGVAQAQSVGVKNGVVTLYGGDTGIVRVSGIIDASGKDQGEKGGTVHVLGNKVGLFGSAKIDVSGDSGGGEVLLGGDYHGDNPDILNADFTYASQDAVIDARAIRVGDGGKVIAWADNATRFYGSIDARGGEFSGDGGFVETSGKQYLDVNGIQVSASAPAGLAGTWLLDPEDIEIQTVTSPGNIRDVTVNGTRTFSPSAATATLNAATVSGALNAGTNVVITTNVSGTGNGDITVNNAIIKGNVNAASLKLDAARDIIFNASITMSSGFLELVAGGTINGEGTGVGELFVSDSVRITADQIGNQFSIDFTDVAGTQTLELISTGGASQSLTLDVTSSNFDAYDINQDSVLATVALNLPGADIFTASGGALAVTITGSTLSSQIVKPALDYTLKGTGNILLGGLTLDTGKSLSIEAKDGDILDSASNIIAGATTLTASGDIGKIAGTGISLNVASITADAGGDIYVRVPSGNLVIGVIDAGDGAGDVKLETITGSILDLNGGSLNITADNLVFLTSGAHDVGSLLDPIEATYNTLDTTAVGGTAYITRIVAEEDGETDGLLIVDGKIVGGENIDDLVTSLYGEEEGDGDGEDSEDDKEVISESPAAAPGESLPVEDLAADTSTPVSQQTFSPCGV